MRFLQKFLFLVPAALMSHIVFAQEGMTTLQMYEAGQNDQALTAIAQQRDAGTLSPADVHLAAQIHLRANQPDAARAELTRLTESEDEAWKLIGESAIADLDGNSARAVEAATQATVAAPDRFEAFYQLGQAKARANDWAGAAAALTRAAEINPMYAYVHYNAGQAYAKIDRVDLTAEYFERFLKLAPNAPERAAVESLMRTLRGR